MVSSSRISNIGVVIDDPLMISDQIGLDTQAVSPLQLIEKAATTAVVNLYKHSPGHCLPEDRILHKTLMLVCRTLDSWTLIIKGPHKRVKNS